MMMQALTGQTESVNSQGSMISLAGPDRRKLATALSPVFNAFTGLVATAVLARLLSVEYFGLYSSWIYAASILTIVFSLGFPAANSYLAARYSDSLDVIFGHAVATSLTFGLAGAVALLWYTQTASVTVPLLVFLPVALLVPMTVAQSAINGALLGSGRHGLYAFVSGLQGVANVAFCTALLFVPADNQQIFHLAITGYAIATAIALAVNLGNTGRIGAPDLAFLWKCLPQSLPLWAHSIFSILLQRADVLVLSFILTPADVGTYALAGKLSESLSYLPQGMSLALFSDLARSHRNDAVRIAGSFSRICLLAGLAGALPAYLFFTFVLPSFVPAAAMASEFLPLMLTASVILGPVYLFCSFSQAAGQPRDVLAMTGVAVIARLSALTVSAVLGGLKAVPFALVLAAITASGFALALVARRTSAGARELIVPSRGELRIMRRLFPFAQENPR